MPETIFMPETMFLYHSQELNAQKKYHP